MLFFVAVGVVGVAVAGLVFLFMRNRWPMGPSTGTIEPTPTPTVAIIINQTSSELPLSKPLNQAELSRKIQAAWDELIEKAPTNVAMFRNDTRLIAISTTNEQSTESDSIVVYRHRPLVLNIEPDNSISAEEKTRVEITSDQYRLAINLRYSPTVTSLDVEAVLNQAFNQLLTEFEPNTGTPIEPVSAFK